MAGAHLQVDLHQLKRIQDYVAQLSGVDRLALLDAIGFEVENQTRRRIAEEKTGPDGQRWKPWSERYARTRHGGHSLLVGESDLLDSIQHLVTGDEVAVGSNLPYAAIHQFGGAEVGMPGLPERPYLGLSPENEGDLLQVVEGFMREAIAP